MADIDLDWAAFDAQRGTTGRQAANDPVANPVIPLSPAAAAQVKKIQAEAGLPQTGVLDPATIAYTKAAYQTSLDAPAAKKAAAAAKKAANAKTAAVKKQAAAEKKAANAKASAAKKAATAQKQAAAKQLAAQKAAAAQAKKNAASVSASQRAAAKAAAAQAKVQAAATKAAKGTTTTTKTTTKTTKTPAPAAVSLSNDGGSRMDRFGGKRAAPFVKGGGRSTTHPNDAKGRARKVKVAKARAKSRRMGSTLDNAITPGGRIGDASPLGKGPRRLTDQEREIAHALIRKGHPKSEAIAMARGLVNKAAATGRWGDHGRASIAVQTASRASVAQRASFTNGQPWTDADLAIAMAEIDLGSDGAKWKHGWVPLNAQAVAFKTHKAKAGGSDRGSGIGKAAKSRVRGTRVTLARTKAATPKRTAKVDDTDARAAKVARALHTGKIGDASHDDVAKVHNDRKLDQLLAKFGTNTAEGKAVRAEIERRKTETPEDQTLRQKFVQMVKDHVAKLRGEKTDDEKIQDAVKKTGMTFPKLTVKSHGVIGDGATVEKSDYHSFDASGPHATENAALIELHKDAFAGVGGAAMMRYAKDTASRITNGNKRPLTTEEHYRLAGQYGNDNAASRRAYKQAAAMRAKQAEAPKLSPDMLSHVISGGTIEADGSKTYSSAQLFRMSGKELNALAAKGNTSAKQELARRLANKQRKGKR